MGSILSLTILQLACLIKKKKISPVEIVDDLVTKIDRENKKLNVFIDVSASMALSAASNAEKEIMSGDYKGPLHGVPLSVKDLIAVKGMPTTDGSIINKDFVSAQDAPVITRLRAEGAIIIGKTNLDEFANHITGKNKTFGTIRNPINLKYSAGGSSGGSAASVAANMAYGSIGTDTAGSIRIPASCCGIVGLKPTYNLVPTHGVTPLSWSLDHVGPLAKTCEDLATLLNAIAPGANHFKLDQSVKISRLSVGVPDNYFFEDLEDEVRLATEDTIDDFATYGAEIKRVKMHNVHKFLSIHFTISAVESAYYHAQFLERHKNDYDESNYEFFRKGLAVTKKEYIEALTLKRKLRQQFQNLFSNIDILITPTLPITPPKLEATKFYWRNREEDILTAMIRFTEPFNTCGLPALSVPVAFSNDGLPIGIQIVANIYQENLLLSVGNWLMGIRSM